MACLSQQQSVTGSQASKSTRAISHTQTAVWLKPPHQIYQQFPSWRSRLQSRNNHSGAHVSVMETQPVSPLKIEHQTSFSSPSAAELWFGLSAGPLTAPWWDYRVCFSQKPKPLHLCVKISKYVLTKRSWHSKFPAASYSLCTLRLFNLLPHERNKKWIIKLWPVRIWVSDFQQLIA